MRESQGESEGVWLVSIASRIPLHSHSWVYTLLLFSGRFFYVSHLLSYSWSDLSKHRLVELVTYGGFSWGRQQQQNKVSSAVCSSDDQEALLFDLTVLLFLPCLILRWNARSELSNLSFVDVLSGKEDTQGELGGNRSIDQISHVACCVTDCEQVFNICLCFTSKVKP